MCFALTPHRSRNTLHPNVKTFQRTFLPYLLPIAAVLVVVLGYTQYSWAAAPRNYVCKHQFALCTSAICVPLPGDPTKAICFCDVEEGPSFTTQPCETLAPRTDKNGIRTVFSQYSYKQFGQGKKGMKCPSGTPWTWCLNKRCTVDPANPKKAICTCDVLRSGEWMTLGGKCDTRTCQTGYWSGASLADIDGGTKFLMAATGDTKWPIKWCPQ